VVHTEAVQSQHRISLSKEELRVWRVAFVMWSLFLKRRKKLEELERLKVTRRTQRNQDRRNAIHLTLDSISSRRQIIFEELLDFNQQGAIEKWARWIHLNFPEWQAFHEFVNPSHDW
jgi:hypothetical protein